MQIGLVGLGRMGANMSRRWQRNGHTVVGYARTAATVDGMVEDGSINEGAHSLPEMVGKLSKPRVLWLMVPAASVDATIAHLVPLLEKGDILIDGGNSYYQDDIRRSKELEPVGIRYLDCGTSGGTWGLERGYCLMIGGPDDAVAYLDPIFRALAPGVGVRRSDARPLGRADDGRAGLPPLRPRRRGPLRQDGPQRHRVRRSWPRTPKGSTSSITPTQARRRARSTPRPPRSREPEHYQYELDLPEIAELWRRGSVVASWLLDLTAQAFLASPQLE